MTRMPEAARGAPRRTQAERRSRSEEALLDAAAALIAERGIDRASLTTIGDRAGTSRGLPTHHFGTKDAMIARLAQRAQQRLSAEMVAALEGSDLDVERTTGLELLRRFVGIYLDLFVDPAVDDLALVALWGAMIPAEASVDGMIDADRRAVEGWAAMIERGHADGSISTEVDPMAAGATLFALTRGVAALLLIDPALVDLAAVRRMCDDFVARALAPPGTRQTRRSSRRTT
jgi:AcrR family transcriptional regulator